MTPERNEFAVPARRHVIITVATPKLVNQSFIPLHPSRISLVDLIYE